MTGMTWLSWDWLTWWVTSLVREDGEKGVYNGCPLLEQGEDHLQPIWAQQLEQLEGEWKSVVFYIKHRKQTTRTQPTCKYILWITSTPKLAATAKAEHLVTTMQVENMPNHSHLALSEWQKKNNKILYTAAIAAAHIENHCEKRLVQTINIILSHKWKWYEVLSLKNSGPEGK